MSNTEANRPDPTTPEPPGKGDPTPPSARERPGRQSVGRNLVASLGAQAVSWVAAIVTVTILPRYLGPYQVGQLRVATAMWVVAGSFIVFGTDQSVLLRIARSDQDIDAVVAAAVRLRLLLWTVAGGVIAGILALTGVDTTVAILAAIMGCGALGTVIGSTGLSALQGLENFEPLAKVTATMAVVSAVAIPAAIVADIGLYPMAILLAGSEVLAGALHFWFLGRVAPLRWRTTWVEVRATAIGGLTYLLGGVALVLYREADTIVMAGLVDEEQIGWYTTADRLFGTALVVPTMLMAVTLPVLARVHAEDPDRARRLAEQSFRTLLLVGFPAGIGLALISDRLTLLLFGEAFAGTGPVLRGFGLVIALVSLTTMMAQYSLAIGRERVFYAMLLAGSFATVPLDLLFVPFFDRRYGNGAIGGAASFAVTETVILIAASKVLLPSVASRATAVRVAKAGTATLAMAVAVWPVRDAFPLVSAAVGGAAFVLATVALRTLERHELDLIEPVLRRLPGPVRARLTG